MACAESLLPCSVLQKGQALRNSNLEVDIETLEHIAVSLHSLLGMCAFSYSKPLMFSALILSISAVIDRAFFF